MTTATRTDSPASDAERLDHLRPAVARLEGGAPEPADLARLRQSVRRIRDTVLAEYHRSLEPVVRATHALLRDGVPTPALTVCGRGTREIRFSQYLAYFLDPQAHHGLGSGLLRAFAGLVHDPALSPGWWSGSWRVKPEFRLGTVSGDGGTRECVVDIAMYNEDHLLLIENKINAPETLHAYSPRGQLADYDRAVGCSTLARGRTIVRVLLQPRPAPPSSDSWSVILYPDLVRAGCELLRSPDLTGTARENLRRFLMDAAVGPLGASSADLRELSLVCERLLRPTKPLPADVLLFKRLRNVLELPLQIMES